MMRRRRREKGSIADENANVAREDCMGAYEYLDMEVGAILCRGVGGIPYTRGRNEARKRREEDRSTSVIQTTLPTPLLVIMKMST